jgi:malonate decarboxylase beta subunit
MNASPANDLTRRLRYFEASARSRVAAVLDAGSFHEFLPPEESEPSPHLAMLGIPGAFDDGVIIGAATLGGRPVLVIAQEGLFMGGAVGEIHGAKIVGLLRRAAREKPAAVMFMVDSGGVRLHEANAGLIAISEVMRAVLETRAAGVPVFALVGGSCGAFGGMGIVARRGATPSPKGEFASVANLASQREKAAKALAPLLKDASPEIRLQAIAQ